VKPYEQLTDLGKLRRFRNLARLALDDYGLGDARLTFLHWAGNTLYRVTSPRPAPARPAGDLYREGHYLLRIHEPGYQEPAAIELELAWLASMCRDAHLPVPEPVPTRDGRLLTRVSIPGIPGARHASLLRWLKGRSVSRGIGPRHYRAQGRLMARMHDHAAHWQVPPGLTKRHWDWDGFFRNVEGTGMPEDEVWSLLPGQYVEPFRALTRRLEQVMDAWGKGPDVYGLIHADLGVDANLLFWGSPPEARAIDFDDSGFGYWMYDLAIALEHVYDEATYPQVRDALLEGYAGIRALPGEQLARLELFLMAWYVYVSLWCAAMTRRYPHHRDALLARLERAAGLAVHYVELR
jgi:Ser/Thr protein kinase RdoA (MazF antagonist)